MGLSIIQFIPDSRKGCVVIVEVGSWWHMQRQNKDQVSGPLSPSLLLLNCECSVEVSHREFRKH
jgi:hypothetical protein